MNMKKTLYLFILLCYYIGNGQSFKTAESYFNYICKEKEIVCNSIWSYNLSLAHEKNIDNIDNSKKILLVNIQNSIAKINLLKNGFGGDLDLKNNYIDYLTASEKQVNLDFVSVADFKNIKILNFDTMQQFLLKRDLINKEIRDQAEKLNESQVNFAKKYSLNFEVGKNELSKKMKIAVDVFDNHSALYLVFFKVNIAQFNLMKSIKDKNIDLIQSQTKIVDDYIKEGFEKLQNFQPYQNDAALAEATKETLEFYQKEINDFVPFGIAYIKNILKYKEDKNKNAAISAEDSTPEQVNRFNLLTTKVNAAIKEYNARTANYNLDQNKKINNWNQVGEKFIETYIPAK